MTLSTAPMTSRRLGVIVVGLALLIVANYFLRHTLEESERYIRPFLSAYYPDATATLFGPDYPSWKLFLPMRELGGSWTTTTLILTHWLQMRLGAPETWYLLHAALIVVSFAVSHALFRSLVFSFTFAICLAFGTHLYHTYAALGTVSFPLLLIYYELLLFTAVRVIAGGSWRWRAAFVVALLVTAIAYEGWLDLAVYLLLAAAMLLAIGVRHRKDEWRRGLAFCAALVIVVAASYVMVKTTRGYGQTPGSESDVVFNYPFVAPAVEDVISRTISNTYVAATNFLPPSLTGSVAFYRLGGQTLEALQVGYHRHFAYLVPMQAMFFWRYGAGFVFALVLIGLAVALRRLWYEDSASATVVALLLLMLLVSGPTHALVKARPMSSMPLLGYHVMVGVLGASLLISFALMAASRAWTPRWRWQLLAVATWGLVFYGALARPAFLEHQAAQVGLGVDIYPDPLEKLAELAGATYTRPGGAQAYALMPSDRNALQARMSDLLMPLPLSAPAASEWRAEAGVGVSRSSEGHYVEGNDSSWGYQLVSPAIPMRPHRRVVVRWKGRVDEGAVCLGVLDAAERWLAPADNARPEAMFDSGANPHVYIVLANCNAFEHGNRQSRFLVTSITYAVLETRDPVER